jgi:hypothetical protein
MHRHHVVFRELATFFAAQFSADCIINIFGFNLRQAQSPDSSSLASQIGFPIRTAGKSTLIRIIAGSHGRKAEHFGAAAFRAARLLHDKGIIRPRLNV